MANPWHDAEGKFASRDELKTRIATALAEHDYTTYHRERKNFEDIEAEIAVANTDTFPTIDNETVSLGEGDDEIWSSFKSSQGAFVLTPSHQNVMATYAVMDTDPEETLNHDPEGVFLTYEASASRRGLEDYEETYKVAAVLHEVRDIEIEADVKVLDVEIADTKLIAAKRNQAINYREWRKQTEKGIDLYRDMKMTPTQSANAFRREVQLEREKLQESLTSVKGDFVFYSQEIQNDAANGHQNYKENSKKLIDSVVRIQSYHDGLIFNRLKEKKLNEVED